LKTNRGKGLEVRVKRGSCLMSVEIEFDRHKIHLITFYGRVWIREV